MKTEVVYSNTIEGGPLVNTEHNVTEIRSTQLYIVIIMFIYMNFIVHFQLLVKFRRHHSQLVDEVHASDTVSLYHLPKQDQTFKKPK